MNKSKIFHYMLIMFFLIPLLLQASSVIVDSDLDGVPDEKDECPNTPFLAKVNAKGCIVEILLLPTEKERDLWVLTFGKTLFRNNENQKRTIQHSYASQLSYFKNNWILSFKSGLFFSGTKNSPIDTTLKIRKRMRLSYNWRITAGTGLRLPTSDLKGNATDLHLYLSSTYYPFKRWSIYAGDRFTIVRDTHPQLTLHNTHSAYGGVGYFFFENLQLSFNYTYLQSRFAHKRAEHYIDTNMFYQINEHLYFTISYGKERFLNRDVISFRLGIMLPEK